MLDMGNAICKLKLPIERASLCGCKERSYDSLLINLGATEADEKIYVSLACRCQSTFNTENPVSFLER